MDYRKINSHIILLLIVIIVGLFIAMVGRLIVLERGADAGTANLAFVIICGVCVIIYLIILAALAHAIIPWIMKTLSPQKNAVSKVVSESVPNEKEEMPKQSIEAIRQDSEKRYIKTLNAKINLFVEYSHLTLAPYITDSELLLLNEYIECYAREESLSKDIIPIKPDKLKNPDIFHFGWNMAHYFDYPKQDVVPWLQQVFLNLRDLESSYIKGKLYDSQTKTHIIPNIDDIPKFLAEQSH